MEAVADEHDSAFGIGARLAQGREEDVGATNVEFNKVGEVLGSFKELEVKNGKFETIKIH